MKAHYKYIETTVYEKLLLFDNLYITILLLLTINYYIFIFSINYMI
jgi:hypothetical protein